MSEERVAFCEHGCEEGGAFCGAILCGFEEESGDAWGGGEASELETDWCDLVLMKGSEEVQESECVFDGFGVWRLEPGELVDL
ncbi:MAG: hypothetical protein RL215_547 [Planctomycetota bacterium]